jgi:hypothetical protein
VLGVRLHPKPTRRRPRPAGRRSAHDR